MDCRGQIGRQGRAQAPAINASMLDLRVGGAVADGFFGEIGLLADAIGDFGEFALIGTDGRQVIDLADQIEGAKSFPDLFVARIDGSDIGAGGYGRAGRDG